jgi:carboxypeptidase T
MATLIARVTSPGGRPPLARLITAPLGLDVWEVRSDHLVLQADEAQAARLEAMGYQVEQLHTTESYLSDFATARAFGGYHTVQTLEQDLRRLANDNPEIVELHEIGRSVENRPLWALRIGERRGTGPKVAVLGCHHPREWISVEVPYRLAEHLVANASADPVRRWLQEGEVWVAPMVNPDGHDYTRTEDRLWRKNRRRNPDGSVGVDPNRNYGYMWGVLNVNTSSHVPSDETYVGPRAFSEPEVRAVRNLVARELVDGVLTYHSRSSCGPPPRSTAGSSCRPTRSSPAGRRTGRPRSSSSATSSTGRSPDGGRPHLDRPPDADGGQQRRAAAQHAARAGRVGAPPRLAGGRRDGSPAGGAGAAAAGRSRAVVDARGV